MLEKAELETFLYSLLCKRKRRVCILLHWFACKSFPYELDEFFKLILTEPIKISIYPQYFRIFERQGLNIKYTWLSPEEQKFIQKMFKHRGQLFQSIEFYMNSSFTLRRCVFNGLEMWPIQNRREFLRDFVCMFLSKFEFGNLLLIHICQKYWQMDRFILELHDTLQGRGGEVKDILCVY
jgi:hypothetical protein